MVSGRSSPPVAFMTNNSELPVWLLVKTIFVPSGEYAGESSIVLFVVSRLRSLPSGRIV